MKQRIKTNILILPDIILVNISLLLAYLLRFDGDWSSIPQNFTKNIFHLALISTVVKIICYIVFRIYDSIWRYASLYELVSLSISTVSGNIVMLGYVFLARVEIPRSIFLITLLLDILLIGGIRVLYRVFRSLIFGETLKFKDRKRVMIIGGGDAGAMIIKEISTHRELKSKVVAIIDDNKDKAGRKINGVPIIGGRESIIGIIEKKKIDEIIIAIPSASHKDINEIVNICSETDCKVKILPSVSQLIDGSVVMQKIRDIDIEDLLGREPVALDMEEISSYLKGRRVLITGAGGSIGSELCRQVASFEPELLIMLDNYENSLYDIQNELLFSSPALKLASVIANIREKSRLESIFAQYKPDVVFHAAAHKHVPLMEANPTEAIKNNVFGTLNVAECADHFKTKRFVLISTDKAVNPTNVMGATKRIAELIIQGMGRRSATKFTAVRFGNVLGSNGSIVPLFKKQIEQGGPVTVTHPEVIRYFMTIPEAVQLVIQSGAIANNGDIFVLDMGKPVRIYDLARKMIKLSGFEPDVDINIEFTGLRPGEKLYEELLMAEEGLQATRYNKIFVAPPVYTDIAMLRRELEILREIAFTNNGDIFEYIKTIVPTYSKAENGG